MGDVPSFLQPGGPPPIPGAAKPPPIPGAVRPPPIPPSGGPAKPKARVRSHLLDESVLHRYENLLVFARTTVEGYFAGKHRSPHFGFSSEFVEYKAHTQGQDPGRIDWRVYARTRKLFARQFLEETDMTIYLMVDISPSMGWRSSDFDKKQTYAARIAAALAYLMLKQGDKAALYTMTDHLTDHVPAGGTRRHLTRLLTLLEKPTGYARKTDLAKAVQQAAKTLRKRGKIVVLSDFLGMDREAFFDALGPLLHRGFEVMLMQVLDPEERTLPDVGVARFRDVETAEEVQVEVEEVREHYQRTMTENIESLRAAAVRRRISHVLLDTSHPYLEAIEAWLGFRQPGKP